LEQKKELLFGCNYSIIVLHFSIHSSRATYYSIQRGIRCNESTTLTLMLVVSDGAQIECFKVQFHLTTPPKKRKENKKNKRKRAQVLLFYRMLIQMVKDGE